METEATSAPGSRQLRLAALVFIAVLATLAGAYYFFLRADYVVIFSDLRPAETTAIVAEMDRQGVAYELRDNGSTILAPADKAASIRVAAAEADPLLQNMVGFELFNESNMGLTDFAQRVNYQRALQGELARTIMLMDGIESARVHLAMPERSLFRGNRSEPKAAVTVIPRKGEIIDERRVLGIQELVAAAVPDLSLSDVVVLDEMGRAISRAAENDAQVPPLIEEHEAVRQYYRARARAAVEHVFPGLRFDLHVVITPRSAPNRVDAVDLSSQPMAVRPANAANGRNFLLRIILLTPSELSPHDQALIRRSVTQAVGLDEASGDILSLSVAAIDLTDPLPVVGTAEIPPLPANSLQQPRGWPLLAGPSLALLALAAGAGALGVILVRRRGAGLSAEERNRFVQRIRDYLNAGGNDVRA